jgi:hypothetical protein
MTAKFGKHVVPGVMVIFMLCSASAAQAQLSSKVDMPWSVEFGIGWDNDISGNINSSGIGQLRGQTVVILKNSYEDVYGTGLHLRFGGGYMFRPNTEFRATFTFQSLDADFVTPMGDIGVSKLYGQYTDYQTFGLDVGGRRYGNLTEKVRGYGEATLGIGFVDKTDITLVAPSINFTGKATDFYDQTAAFSFGFAGGLMIQTGDRVDLFTQLGFRWMSGMAPVDDLEATGLETINDKSSRWTMPFIAGVRYRF